MKFRGLLLVALASTLIVGCKSKNEEETPSDPVVVEDLTPDFQFDAEIVDTMDTLEDKSVYQVKLNFTDKYFKYTASTFKKDLMLLSYGCAMSMVEKDIGEKFYSDIGFSVLYTAEEYETGSTEDSVQYFIASKNIEDFTVFSVGIRGNRYGLEWASNFTLGESGDHVGFMQSASKVYQKLVTYIGNTTNYKLWFSGYSRAGGVANVLSYLCMTSTTLNVTEDNLYTYTFAGTRALTQEHASAYKNIFNIYNSADIISNFAPKEFGLYRCGRDIDIFDEKLDEYLSDFSSELVFPTFTESEGVYKNDQEFTAYVLRQLLKDDPESFNPSKYPYNLTSRANFYQIQEHVSYLLSRVLGTDYYMEALSETFGELNQSEIMNLVSDDGTKLHDKFVTMFTNYSVSYDDTKLTEACSVVVLLIKRYVSLILTCISNSNATRMINMHMTETNYILIRRFEYHD